MKHMRSVILFLAITSLLHTCNMAAVSGRSKIRTDAESINKGKVLFDLKCRFCHKTDSTLTIAGPGLSGILKNSRLPVSKKAATPANIIDQLKSPYKNMPRFAYLTEEEMRDIIAYLNTL